MAEDVHLQRGKQWAKLVQAGLGREKRGGLGVRLPHPSTELLGNPETDGNFLLNCYEVMFLEGGGGDHLFNSL